MKPAFALDFRNDAVSLLHRTTGGWHQVGRVAFDDPDMPAALGYLRSTALGLSPRGVATKLILPDDQILVTTLDAPGPDEASRVAQIRAGLEGRTPYPVDDLIFDWEVVGGEVRVAVIARETLAEAEAFATEHRFNPVSFAAAPASGFTAEPWFGPTSHAAALLADGEVVERDIEQITVLSRGLAEEFARPQEAEIAPEPEAEVTPEPEAEVIPASEAEVIPEPEVEFIPALEVASEPEAEIPPAPEVEPEGEPLLQPEAAPTSYPAFDAPPAPQADLAPWPTVTPQEDAHLAEETLPEAFPVPDPEQDDLPEDQQADLEEDLPPPAREQSVFGLADDEAPPSQAIRAPAPPRVSAPRPKERRGQDFWGKPQSSSTADPRPAPALPPSRPTAGMADEAPMALDVEDADQIKPGNPAAPSVATPDDVRPISGGFSPSMGFASRRASADQGAGPKLAAPPRPTVARPSIAKPLPPVAPRAERPMVDRPTAVNPSAGRESKGLRGLGALVGAPGLTGGKKKVQIPSSTTTAPGAAPAQDQTATAPKRPSALTKAAAARRAPVRGKPRHLGLILTGILLLLLALIAAYSTTLAFQSDDSATTEFAAEDSTLPAPEDEMLADGVMLDDLPADEVALAPEADLALPVQDAPEATVEAAVEAPATPTPEEPVAAVADATAAATAPAAPDDSGLAAAAPAAGVSAADDIVLAAKDPAPKVPSPLDPPEAIAQGDPLPTTQAAPPPFGTVYQFDAKGMIVPTPEGIITPEGVRLVAGKPPRVPKSRPESLTVKTPAADEAASEATTPQTVADPALAGARPKARPEGLVAPAEASEAPAVIDNRLVGKRPMARPEAVLAAGEAINAAKASAAASLAAQAEAIAAANAPASQLAIAISRRPAPRPVDLSRAVEAAVAAAVRLPEPMAEPEPQPVSQVIKTPTPEVEAPQPTIMSSKPPKSSGGRDRNQEEADAEPELASAPSGGSKGSVSKQATFKNALNLDKTALIGIYGTPSNRYAMIRTAGGRYKKVSVGDRIDSGRIQAITASELRYQKGSRLVTLALPKG